MGLIVADVVSLLIVYLAIYIVRDFLFEERLPPLHWAVYLSGLVWLLFRWISGSYGYCHTAPVELKESFRTSLVAALVHLAVLLADGEIADYRLISLLIWPAVLPFTYSLREAWRGRRIAAGRYGVPVAIIGNGVIAGRAIRELRASPTLGYVPVALFSTERSAPDEFRQVQGVPMVGRAEEAASYQFPYKIQHIVLAVGDGWHDARTHRLATSLNRRYHHVQIFTNLTGSGHWLSQARPLGPYVTIHTRNLRLTRSQRLAKRALDIAISLPALILSTPIIFAAGIAIKISDPGPVFFGQMREGRNGKPIKIYKLRSMIQGAEQKLAKHLAENEAARFEYERTMKLREDPRILPVIGQLIRKASIDELPQFWSILKGDMSLVGPRVMPTREIDLYSETAREIRRDMPPGLTGFWQVEHRSDSDFQVRETADTFYVANWSIWLDLWIILRTFRIVLTGAGAF